MDISEVSLGTVQGHTSEQQSPEKDFERAKAVLEQILQDDPATFDSLIDACLNKQSIEERILFVCDEGVRLCTTPDSPYFALGLNKYIIDRAMELRTLTEVVPRLRVLNACAKLVRTEIKMPELAKRITDTLYIAASPAMNPMAIATQAVKLLPPARHEKLLKMRKRYQSARGE
ncbi:MAG: hypothetical protein KC582_00370 [Candidatus Magasanikbacteria bacterium]|nr:hypothetical protein [Candidatus Magasanikbacteria bacterium]